MAAENWPLPRYAAASKAQMHALGVVMMNFNTFEYALFSLFAHPLVVRGINETIAWNIYSQTQESNQQVIIKYLYMMTEKDKEVLDRVEHVVS